MYGKIWMSLFEGSLYAAGWEAIFTFMILITFANKKGEVQMSLDHLSGRLTQKVNQNQMTVGASYSWTNL
jgi:hypothetical protein